MRDSNRANPELVLLDVRELAPPEPMTAILSALAILAPQQILKVSHRREPFPLYERLEAADWCHHCKKINEDLYVIHIFKHENKSIFKQTYEHSAE